MTLEFKNRETGEILLTFFKDFAGLIPRVNDDVIINGNHYVVSSVVHNLDEGEIIVYLLGE